MSEGAARDAGETGALRCGLFVSNQHLPDDDLRLRMEEHLDQVRLARELGLDSVLAGQHYLTPDFAMFQPLPFLARAAAEAGPMEIGFGILLLALHNPVAVAEQTATLDVLSGGRLIVGVGLGYREEEFAAFGVPRGGRARRLMESLELVRRLWLGESVSHRGETGTLERARLLVRPLRRPQPPVWMAANGDRAVRRAARCADAWMMNPHARLETLERQLALYRAEREAAGLPAARELVCMRELCVAEERETALRDLAPHLARKYATYVRWGQDRPMPDDDPLDLPYEALKEGRFVLGDVEDVTKALEELVRRLGARHLVFRVQWPGTPHAVAERTLRLLAERVLPELRRRLSAPEAAGAGRVRPAC